MSNNPGLEHVLNTSQHRYALPHGARQLILLRHGSAGGDYSRTVQVGELHIADPPLLPAGHQQAIAAAQRLARETISHIFVTPLIRTVQTAAPLAEMLGIEPTVIAELHEVHMGDWENEFHLRVTERHPLLKRMLVEESYEIVPNAERAAVVAARVRIGIGKVIANLDAGSSAVVVVHGGIIGEVCRQATASRPFAFFGPENASITRLVVNDDGRWTLRGFNDVSHLAEV
jgi:probable phosphoglycerate mutase